MNAWVYPQWLVHEQKLHEVEKIMKAFNTIDYKNNAIIFL